MFTVSLGNMTIFTVLRFTVSYGNLTVFAVLIVKFKFRQFDNFWCVKRLLYVSTIWQFFTVLRVYCKLRQLDSFCCVKC